MTTITAGYTKFLTVPSLDSELSVSIGSIGDCFENAVIEPLWARASRTPESPTLEDPQRAVQCDIRVS